MVILDTNVVSEMMKAPPWPGVKAWLAAQPRLTVFISAITEAELRLGVALLPVGRRRNGLAADIEAMIAEDFAGRVLAFDSPAAKAFAAIVAVARSRGASIATRNIGDFEGCGVEVINPWDQPA
jgi:predicted nucleic acid-binding protein